jgi:hypothetical protein
MPKNALAPASVNALTQPYFGNPNIAAQAAKSRAMRGGYASTEQASDVAKTALGFTPVVGDIMSGYDAVQAARQGNYGEAALNAVGLLPFVPSLAGITKNISKVGENAYDFIGKNNKKYRITIDPEEGAIRTFANDGKLVGELDAASLKGYTFSAENGAQAAFMAVEKEHQRNGINTAMNEIARQNIPGYTIKSNMFTPEGLAWYNSVISKNK